MMNFLPAGLALLLAAMLPGGTMQPGRLPPIDSFVCYYGRGHVEELSRYSLVILEARNYSAAEVLAMRRAGAVVVGYLSVGEILEEPDAAGVQRAAGGDPGLPPYYLDADGDGKPDRNPGWGALYVDARSPRWHQRVLDELIPALIREKGVDGVFLDTLDTVDRYPQTKAGMQELVGKIRHRFPRIPIVANRGFTLLESLAENVDAILFEAFSTRWDPQAGRSTLHPAADLEWVDATLRRIRAAGGEAFPVLVLDYADPEDDAVARAAVARAKEAGLAYSITVGSLDRLPMEGGAGRSK